MQYSYNDDSSSSSSSSSSSIDSSRRTLITQHADRSEEDKKDAQQLMRLCQKCQEHIVQRTDIEQGCIDRNERASTIQRAVLFRALCCSLSASDLRELLLGLN